MHQQKMDDGVNLFLFSLKLVPSSSVCRKGRNKSTNYFEIGRTYFVTWSASCSLSHTQVTNGTTTGTSTQLNKKGIHNKVARSLSVANLCCWLLSFRK